MDCNKWEETGLLFSSGELSSSEAEQYSEHLKECQVCSGEYSTYTAMKGRLFTADILQAQPSAACDAEILRVCSVVRKPLTSLSPLSLIFKRTLVSVSLFVFGFIGVTYVAMQMNNRGVSSVQVAETVNSATDSMSAAAADSLSDSAYTNSVNYAKTRGNLGLKGVVPVDLQNK